MFELMDKNMSQSNGAESTQAPSSEINSLEKPMPLIPILNSNINPGINDSTGYHLQEIIINNPGIDDNSSVYHTQEMMMPVPSSDAMVADNNNLNYELSLMLENSLMNPVHRRYYSDPAFSNDAYNFGSNFGAESGGHTDAYRKSFVIFDDFDDETLSKFFNVNESDNSSASMALSPRVREQSNTNIFRSMPSLPPLPPVLTRFDFGKTVGISKLEMNASSSTNSTINMLMESGRRHISNDELAEIFRIDPRHAKRILANRKSAAKLKEKKEKHKAELEDKVRFLQAKVATLRARVEAKESELSSLTAENKRLQFLLEVAEESYQLKGALNEVLKDEIEYLNLMALNAGTMVQGQHIYSNYSNNPTNDLLMTQQLQQLHINNQQQIQDGNYIGSVSEVSLSDDSMEEN